MKRPSKIESFERLLEYGAWYISRYGISKKKLMFQLRKKSAVEGMAEEVMGRLERFVDDRREIESRLLSAISIGQSPGDLRSKLLSKSFLKDDIDSVFEKYESEFSDFSQFETTIRKRIATLRARKYGSTRIESELLREYPKFRNEIRGMVSEDDPSENPIDAFSSERNTLVPGDQKGKQKLFAKLVRRGFRVDEVRKFLAISEEES